MFEDELVVLLDEYDALDPPPQPDVTIGVATITLMVRVAVPVFPAASVTVYVTV